MQNGFQIEEQDINSAIRDLYNLKLKNILDNISSKYSISNDDLYDEYLIDKLDTNMLSTTSCKKKRKKNKILAPNQLCLARKADGEQCTRRKKDSCDFCGKHSGTLKYGRIDDDTKHSSDSFIQCTPITINGTEYLVDNKKVVYSYNIENPEIIGGLDSNGNLINYNPADTMVNCD